MTTRERSAGVVVYRTGPAGRREYLLLNYGRHWGFAKGHLEGGEDDLTAARRELFEETAIDSIQWVDGFSETISYAFRVPPRFIRKTVIFFLARTDSDAVILSPEHIGYAWLSFDLAIKRVRHRNTRQVLQSAEAALNRLTEPDRK